jgi:hypothetical protein
MSFVFTKGGSVFIFGGRNYERNFDDLYEFNTELLCWNEIPQDGNRPSPRHSATLSALPRRNMFLLVGGNDGKNLLNDCFILTLIPTENGFVSTILS